MVDESRQAHCAALATFHDQLQRLLEATEQRTRQAGLQRLKFLCLLAISRQPAGRPATVGVLTEALRLDRNAVGELVDDLVRQGFVVRERDRGDRRRVLISLTEAGDEWLAPLVDEDLRGLAALGPDLLRTVRTVLAHAAASGSRRQEAVPLDVQDFAWRSAGVHPI